MDDAELNAIRQQRLAELQSQGYGGGQGQGQGGPSPEQQEEMQRQATDQKNSILSQVLVQEARARLNTIAVTKPDKARAVEGMLIQMARSGQISPANKLKDDQLKQLLTEVSQRTQKCTTVKFNRRRVDSDDDDY
ncbi:programmed cell death protein 5-like [Lineus longissimus]|uniref:programmed cell death protein 5-like n=1 Tax=Lineus longissimus TaxID=88925 RepID=UPI002B4CD217